MSQTDRAQDGRMPERLLRRCPSEGREKLFMLDGEKRMYRCGCGNSAAGAAEAVLELDSRRRDALPASLTLRCEREERLRSFGRREGTTRYECPCGLWSQDVGKPGSRPDETDMYECIHCGGGLDHLSVCVNPDCLVYPEGDLMHSHIPERILCTDEHCPEHEHTLGAERQLHCGYCHYTAGYDGSCDDDQCPSHHPDFDPREEPWESTGAEHEPGAGHWLVKDGLVRPDGTLTEIGKEHEEWVMDRMPDGKWPGAGVEEGA